ncbi:MAG TPA: winged helix-turn-helix transcriptional regulator [Nitrososphaerales archaeon]|nr:winged helix-turn-helix transcriptional regulator [Nitrososphaerales archaeon]
MQRARGDLGVRVLRELTSPGSLQWNFRESYSKLSKSLGADEETVRLTLKRALDSGFIEGWRLVLNPHLFGGSYAGAQLDVDPSVEKSRVISQISLIDGVFLLFDFSGPGLRAAFYYNGESSLQRKVELMREICHQRRDDPVLHWRVDAPPCRLKLRSTDWKIIRAIRKDPRRNSNEVARELGLSTRTVNRRLKLMTEDKVGYLLPLRNVRKSKGVMCTFLVFCPESKKEGINEMARSVADRVDFAYNSVKGLCLLTLFVDNLPEADEICESLRNAGGVSEVRMGILKNFIFVDDWVDEKIDEILSSERNG